MAIRRFRIDSINKCSNILGSRILQIKYFKVLLILNHPSSLIRKNKCIFLNDCSLNYTRLDYSSIYAWPHETDWRTRYRMTSNDSSASVNLVSSINIIMLTWSVVMIHGLSLAGTSTVIRLHN